MDYENMTAQDFKDEMVQRREKIYRKIKKRLEALIVLNFYIPT